MSDVLKSLLAAYKTDLETVTQTGGSLSFIWSYYVIPQTDVLPPDFSTPLPCLLIYPLTITTPLMCLGAYVYQKDYQIGLTLIQEGYGEDYGLITDTADTSLVDNLNAIEERYHDNTLSITNACRLLSVDYQLRNIPAFISKGLLQGTIILQHYYEDFKA